jgi:hypothetical protein
MGWGKREKRKEEREKKKPEARVLDVPFALRFSPFATSFEVHP